MSTRNDWYVACVEADLDQGQPIAAAQQENVDRDPDRPFVPTIHDRGITLHTRLKARLIAEAKQ